MDPYATHLPYLLATVHNTGGPVLEVGSGWYSTLPLRAVLWKRRSLVTIENDSTWRDRWSKLHAPPWHEIRDWPTGTPLPLELGRQFSVGLLDHEPHTERPTLLPILLKCCDFVVIHDSNQPGYDWSLYPRRREFTELNPSTMIIGSQLEIPNDWFD